MTEDSRKLAIEGGTPTRADYLPYGMHEVTDDDIAAVERVLRGSWLTTGPEVETFEKALAASIGATSAAAVSSGTAALHLAYMAADIGAGDEIITSPLTFAATSNAALHCGAMPVFADVDETTLNLDPETVRAAITPKTRAVVPVHFTGRPCDLGPLKSICVENELLLIEDACHALGARYEGMMIGAGGVDLSCWSFHPVKHVAAGEGGAVTSTSRPELIESVKRLRNHGIDRDARERLGADATWAYEIRTLGFNYRIPDINCALATSQLGRLGANLERRRELAKLYAEKLGRFEELRLPPADDATYLSAWHLYVVRLRLKKLRAGRAEIFAALRAENIGVNVHYIPVHLHPIYEKLGFKPGACPVAEQAYEELLTLPLFGTMKDSDLEDVTSALDKVLRRYSRA